jgi:hypothetical protein
MRDHGRFTSMQGHTLKERMDKRVGEDTESFTAPMPERATEAEIKHPPAIDLNEWKEEENIVDNPAMNPQREFEQMEREDDQWMRRPLGDT